MTVGQQGLALLVQRGEERIPGVPPAYASKAHASGHSISLVLSQPSDTCSGSAATKVASSTAEHLKTWQDFGSYMAEVRGKTHVKPDWIDVLASTLMQSVVHEQSPAEAPSLVG